VRCARILYDTLHGLCRRRRWVLQLLCVCIIIFSSVWLAVDAAATSLRSAHARTHMRDRSCTTHTHAHAPISSIRPEYTTPRSDVPIRRRLVCIITCIIIINIIILYTTRNVRRRRRPGDCSNSSHLSTYYYPCVGGPENEGGTKRWKKITRKKGRLGAFELSINNTWYR